MDEPFLQVQSFPTPLVWICITLFISLFYALLIRRLLPQRHMQQWQYITDSARWILLPYLGLLFGALSPRLMGLTEINWLNSLSLGSGLIALTATLIVLVQTTTAQHSVTDSTSNTKTLGNLAPGNLVESIVTAGAEQFHWSFLRGALWESLLRIGITSSTAAYTGIWLGGLLAALEILLHKQQAMSRLVSLLTLVTTSILFFFTHNFWLCWLLHLITTTMLRQSMRRY